ncbi:response regulator transcription factor [Psychrobacter arenosus]|uniref:response regulator transcription factor n=1 Tax=Psychrobacter arenosus TaxID=256326 RepID=UPI0019190AA6|nr:LuxR C-terminal-related transcriptional regulator [Psychrobacter arenosus]
MMRIYESPQEHSITALFTCDPPIDADNVSIHLVSPNNPEPQHLELAQQIAAAEIQVWPKLQPWLAHIDLAKPSVLICDISQTTLELHALIDLLHAKDSPIVLIVLGGEGDAAEAVALLKRGALDYLSAPFSSQQLQVAVQRARNLTVDRAKLQHMRQLYEQLTDKEKCIAHELMQGNINKVIADNLEVSVRTVEVHRAHVMTKMQASHSSELIQKLLLITLWKGYAPR